MEYKTDLRIEPYRKDNHWWFRVGVREGFVFDVYEGEVLDWFFDGIWPIIHRPESQMAKVPDGDRALTPKPKRVCRIS